jgi:NADPH-dependent glutamate synthase beta subunit-like oxidoreductase
MELGSVVTSNRRQVEVPTDDYWRRQIKCQYACPVETDARGYVRAIADGDFERAYLIARGPNPLASICGRVCGAPCEAACRRASIDQAVSIRALKRFVTERFGPEAFSRESLKPIDLLRRTIGFANRDCSGAEELSSIRALLGSELPRVADTGESVAIIGSGPAGLATAHDLALLGHHPTVFEMEPVPAGMLAVGIPEYRLPRALIEAEVEVIRALGVNFRCNTRVGTDITFDEIRRSHRATIVAVGAKCSRAIPLPGGDGPGVLGGVEFLRDVAVKNRGPDSTLAQLGKGVVVIGGGNVAYDVSRTVIRQIGYDVSRSVLRQADVHQVHLCCLESVDEMPADDIEILEGHEEGVILHASRGPVEIQRGPLGEVTGVKFKRCLRVFDGDGRFAPEFDESDLEVVACDTVLWAIGQKPDLSFIPESSDIRLNDRGLIDYAQETLRTSATDVFLAGDIAYGPRLLIDAVASGKKCARSVHAFLTGDSLTPQRSFVQLNLPEYRREADYERLPRTAVPTIAAERRKHDQQVVIETGFGVDLARTEACRCLDCGVNTIFDSEKCILCGGCADVCPELCLELVSCNRLDGDAALFDTLRETIGTYDLADVSAIIKDEEKCIRCALCAQRCPVGAITMERVGFMTEWISNTA